ncbi:hypothetical protein EMCRGX_G018544 [Ephydatia muelleri]
MRNRNYRSQGTRKPRAQWEAATAPSIGAGHIGRRRSPPGEEESHPQSQAGASVEDNPSARPSSSSVPWPRPASPCSTRAILKIAEMEYSGANSIFLRAFLDKKYALPYHVVDAVFSHFSLLTFVQRHKEDMSLEQKEGLMDLVRVKTHHEISHEVRRELLQSRCRDLGEVLFVDRHNPSAHTAATLSL